MLIEAMQAEEDRQSRVLEQAIAPWRRSQMFGGLVPQESPDDDGVMVERLTAENFNDDEGTVVWQMPQMDPKDAMAVLASMGGGGTMTTGDLDD